MQYQIVADANANALSKRLQVAFENGWELQGGVAIAFAGNQIVFAQAVINSEDAPAPVPIDSTDLLEVLKDALAEASHPD